MYLSIKGEARIERVEQKSRFISFASHAEGEEDARDFLKKVRGEHPLATHVCYAYIADRLGNEQRFSDDGEPQGTAGMPILGVVRARELKECAVAVVRYFGGIKLGAGGLVRAYASAASDVLNEAKICEYRLCEQIRLTVSYAQTDALFYFLEKRGTEILSREFGAGASATVLLAKEEREGFLSALTSRLAGKVTAETVGEGIFPFEKN